MSEQISAPQSKPQAAGATFSSCASHEKLQEPEEQTTILLHHRAQSFTGNLAQQTLFWTAHASRCLLSFDGSTRNTRIATENVPKTHSKILLI